MKQVLGGLVLASLVLLGFARPARAALGDDAAAVAANQARLGARLRVLVRPAYAVHEVKAPTGATVREFVGDAGKVFAVAWSGGWRPDLRALMGDHYDRFIAGTRGRRASRGIVRIELPGMTVVMGGYLRSFFGRVVLTDILPAGVAADEVR